MMYLLIINFKQFLLHHLNIPVYPHFCCFVILPVGVNSFEQLTNGLFMQSFGSWRSRIFFFHFTLIRKRAYGLNKHFDLFSHCSVHFRKCGVWLLLVEWEWTAASGSPIIFPITRSHSCKQQGYCFSPPAIAVIKIPVFNIL